MTHSDVILNTALDLARRGWRVFPLVPGRKIPHKGTHGVKDATTKLKYVCHMWQRFPGSNIGLATGRGLVVIDLDVKQGSNGYQNWVNLSREHGFEDHGTTYRVDTPSGGVHLYYRDDESIGNSASKLGPGIDVRGEGGYVVAPPSVVDGAAYRPDGSLDDIQPAPDELLALLKASKSRKRGRPKLPSLMTEDYIELLTSWGFEARMNLCNDLIEINGEPMTDITDALISARVRDVGIEQRVGVNVRHARETITTWAQANAYHPIKDYLNGLTWDGHDHIADLCAHFDSVDDSFPRWFEHWIVGAVAKVFDGYQNPILVLDGGQELGKSYFVRWLCPLKREHYAGAIYPDNKDCVLRLMDTWVWEVEELGSTTRRSDLEALKAFLTMATVRKRRPYGRFDTNKPALASFIGTINNDAGFLLDQTGNRRFLVVTLHNIDWGYAETVDVGQLWAQALVRHKQDESWMLSSVEKDRRDEVNDEYMIDEPVDMILDELVRITGDMNHLVKASRLQTLIENRVTMSSKAVTMAVASSMKKRGAVKTRKRVNGANVRVYQGVTLTIDPY